MNLVNLMRRLDTELRGHIMERGERHKRHLLLLYCGAVHKSDEMVGSRAFGNM